MNTPYSRTGPLMELSSYPGWAGQLVADCAADRARVTGHVLFQRMRDATLPYPVMRHFLIGVWPVIEQFPQYMAFNLLKVRYGRHPGEDLARTWLIRNLRVEQHHADYWVDWAEASDVSRDALIAGTDDPATSALAHWCWRTCEREALAISVAATHYAIEGATGEWSNLVCSTDTYANLFAESERKKATRWLRQHAQYDDTHPWEALDIICTLLGHEPEAKQLEQLRLAICTSYRYMAMTLDRCMQMAPAKQD